MSIKSPKKLIEVALPLDDINAAAAREKSIRHGHPSTLHLWWARRPLAAARAVLFAQMVNDPGGERGYFAGKTKAQADAEREKLFQIIRDLVKWENTNNEEVLERARAEIRKSWRETCELNKGKPGFDPDKLPAFHDPFAGGGAIPLEAQRLGLESYASDLNPVAVLINKAMIEIPPKFAGRKPVGPVPKGEKQGKLHEDWSGARGLAEDVRRYGLWMRDEAEKRIGHLYPKVNVTAEMAVDRPDLKPYVGEELTVIAWLWARTVKSPNPAFAHVDVPLASSFVLSSKKGKEAWVQPVVEGDEYRFEIRMGSPPDEAKSGTKLGRGANFQCLVSGVPLDRKHIKSSFECGESGERLMAIVVDSRHGRLFIPPQKEHENVASSLKASWRPDLRLSGNTRHMTPPGYGMSTVGDLFTERQLTALVTYSELVGEAENKIVQEHGPEYAEYAAALSVYLALAVSRLSDICNALCRWESSKTQVRNLFGRQAVPIVWDFAENNVFGSAAGDFQVSLSNLVKALANMPLNGTGHVAQADAQTQAISTEKVVSSDPPYYDNVPYADLSDFFYAWLRKSLRSKFPEIFSTMEVPKREELVADHTRQGGRQASEEFFMEGMTGALSRISELANGSFPVSIYYAFKQAESNSENENVSTGWVTFLAAVLQSGFTIGGTWPMRTELSNRMRGDNSNALASSIVLVCRKKEAGSETISRRDFQRQLREHMPEALETMIGGTSGQSPIAPVDLAQAAIGPGMAIFSKYAAVVEADGAPMSVHDALILINREITDFLTPDAGNFDNDTLFCNSWFEGFGWSAGPFGDANTLAQAKGTSVGGVQDAGVVESGGGKVRLLRWAEYPGDWDPKTDTRTPIWEAAHHLIRALNQQGESEAGALLARMPEKGEAIRQLAYHLYTLCERKKWADDARAYNELITAWHAIVAASHEAGHRGSQAQLEL